MQPLCLRIIRKGPAYQRTNIAFGTGADCLQMAKRGDALQGGGESDRAFFDDGGMAIGPDLDLDAVNGSLSLVLDLARVTFLRGRRS